MELGAAEIMRMADRMALQALELVPMDGHRGHREALIVTYMALHLLKISYPRSDAELFQALQDAEGVMELFSGNCGEVC